jgi:hypothetical protein
MLVKRQRNAEIEGGTSLQTDGAIRLQLSEQYRHPEGIAVLDRTAPERW